MHEILILIIILAVVFDIANGWHDCANAIATVVSTKVLSPMAAVSLAAGMNILGAFLSTAVAKTVGKGIVDPLAVTDLVIISALLSAILWNLITILMGLPVSSSHALFGGIAGARCPRRRNFEMGGIMKILTALSPPFSASYRLFFHEIDPVFIRPPRARHDQQILRQAPDTLIVLHGLRPRLQ
jgi:PiT family inorganic phosphate transporter